MAAQPPHPKLALNLLYPQGIPQKLPVKLLKWVLTFGRYIAIAVEIVVLATFAARFKLDADLANIKERINQQIPFIESLSATETQIRQMQFKIEVIKQTYNSSPSWKETFDKIANQTPLGIKLLTLSFDRTKEPTQFKIVGTAVSNNDLGAFISGLKTEERFADINLASLAYDRGEISFTITGTIKQ